MPDGFGLLTQDELILELGKSRATIARWRKLGLPVFERRKRRLYFRLKDVKTWIRKSGIDGEHGGDRATLRTPGPLPAVLAPRTPNELLEARAAGEIEPVDEELDGVDEEGLDAAELEALRVDHLKARIRKERAMADKHELEVAKRRGELVERAEVEAAQVARVTYARAVLLGGPGALAGDLVGLGVEAIEERLGGWVRQALELLAGSRGR